MDSNVLIEAERIALLSEIASLEQQIASLSNDKQERLPKRPRPAEDEGAEQGIEETIRALLASNDSALLAAHPPKAKDYEATDQDSVELERVYELLQANSSFTGIELSEADSRLLNVGQAYQTRQHTLVGTLPSPTVPLGFRVRLIVREPVLVEEADPSAVDPGGEYEVQTTEAEVWGGGHELQEAIRELRLSTRPNPPALFSRLREYSLLAAQRYDLFADLRESLSGVLQGGLSPGNGGAVAEQSTVNHLYFTSGVVTLSLTYNIEADESTESDSLIPIVRLNAVLSPEMMTLPERGIHLLRSIPRRFEQMLAEGLDAQKATELLVKAALGQD